MDGIYIYRMFSNLFLKKFRVVSVVLIALLLLITLNQLLGERNLFFSKFTVLNQQRSQQSSTKLSTKDFKRNNANFNTFVQEEENIGGEVVDTDIRGKNGSPSHHQNGDVDAAVEVHSDEQNLFFKLNSKERVITNKYYNNDHYNKLYLWNKTYLDSVEMWNYRNLTITEIANLSVLGRRLYLHENVGQQPADKIFLINVYKYGEALEGRIIKLYTSVKHDPFAKCSVNNCIISYNDTDFHKADAILFHLHRMEKSPAHIQRKNYNQRWIWLSEEGVVNTFTLARDRVFEHYDGIFNWSMTYHSASDIPVPYGRTVPVFKASSDIDIDIFNMKNKTVAIVGSNCGGSNHRWQYVKKLQDYMNVDIYGNCGKLWCPGHYDRGCNLLIMYKFYLSFENVNCNEYITEKVWWNAIEQLAVPVIMGAPKNQCMKFLPPDSFIHVEDFKSPKELAEYITYLSSNKDAYNRYHAWRKKFAALNEHGYFKTNIYHYCRICEALNYNSPEHKTYARLKDFWDESRDCYAPKWSENVGQ